MDKREQKEIANRVAKLERDMSLGKNVKDAQAEIENIMTTLSIEDFIYIDNYIQEIFSLTK